MSPEPRRSARRADGMTLPELLVTVTLMATLATVLAGTISVVFRQNQTSEGRINVARAEQSIDTWLPADLASTDVNDLTLPAVDLDPAATPCGNCGTIDLSGANALQLAWQTTLPGSPPTEVTTRVQYQYVERGPEWVLERIECRGGSPCTVGTILHELQPPTDPSTFDPDADRPVWVMDVAVPAPSPELELSDNARQIVVTVNGGGVEAGTGGGLNSISLTAGGRSTSEIAADEFTVPSFVRARSRCGGPVTIIVDESGSVGSAVDNVVEPGVEAFIDAFRGTPTQVQVIAFSSDAEAVGGGDWHNYVDMTDDAAVNTLVAQLGPQLNAGGGTNWEEAFFHTLKESDGSQAATLPRRIVFFTDGIPTLNRTSWYGNWSSDFSNGTKYLHFNDGEYASWSSENGNAFHQESWDRADVILDAHRDIDLIFVGVGGDLNKNITWRHDPAVYENRYHPQPSGTTKKAWETITYLLANAPTGHVPATTDGSGNYTNPETANWYKQESFDAAAFAAAMKAAALKDCGGTLTIQTRGTDGSPVADEFVYENVEYRDESGTKVDAEARRVTTSSVFRTGTFDFEFAGGATTFEVDIVPQELETLTGFTPVGWSCRAGGNTKSIAPIPIDGSPFTGFTIDVVANEAVSCILTVDT